jgi:hypothetical protein
LAFNRVQWRGLPPRGAYISGITLPTRIHLSLATRPVLFCLLVAAGLSCGGSTSGPSGSTVASVTVNAPSRSIAVGSTVQLSAVAFDNAGAQLIGVTFQWISSDNAIATVSSTGVVTGVAVGSARISAMTGTVSGFADVTVGPTMTTLLTEKPIARG